MAKSVMEIWGVTRKFEALKERALERSLSLNPEPILSSVQS